MSPKTMLLPALFLLFVLGNAIPAAAQAPKRSAAAYTFVPGKYELLKMEYDGKTLEPKESLWRILYMPERDGLGEGLNGVLAGLGSIKESDDTGLFYKRISKCQTRISFGPYSTSGDRRAFAANVNYAANSDRPTFYRVTGLVEFKGDMIIACFKTDKDGDPLKEEIGKGKAKNPGLPPDITAKRGDRSIIYYYKRVR